MPGGSRYQFVEKWLRALTWHTQDSSLLPVTLVPGDGKSSSELHRQQTSKWYTYTDVGKIHKIKVLKICISDYSKKQTVSNLQ